LEDRIEYFERMLADNPDNPTGLLALANEYSNLGVRSAGLEPAAFWFVVVLLRGHGGTGGDKTALVSEICTS
jgi:hypothetical protein